MLEARMLTAGLWWEKDMRTDFDRAYVTAQGNVAILTLNHPEAMNAAGTKLVKGAAAALNFIEKKDSGFRSMILTGADAASGAISRSAAAKTPASDILSRPLTTPSCRLRDLSIPFVTAVNGRQRRRHEYRADGRYVIAARSAYFLQAFTRSVWYRTEDRHGSSG
jgi:hypothetical protein